MEKGRSESPENLDYPVGRMKRNEMRYLVFASCGTIAVVL